MLASLEHDDRTSATIQAENIRKYSEYLKPLWCNVLCLFCLHRKPEHVLYCGHAICDVCTRLFGVPDLSRDFLYTVQQCSYCLTGSTKILLKPPTSGVRILTIDGGGIRGVVPLEFLGILQRLLGPECMIQDMFDLAFGTSSGT